MPWLGRPAPLQLATGSTGVLWRKPRHLAEPVQALILVAREEDQRRLCGRFAQLRSDLSPLTSWCHLLTPRRFESLDSLTRYPDLGGLEAAWTGLIVAETLLLTERSLAQLRISACLATQSFALARAKALWSPASAPEILKRFDDAQQFLRAEDGIYRGESRIERVRAALHPIWASLAGASGVEPIVESLVELRDARLREDKEEARRFAAPLVGSIPEARLFDKLADLTSEQRLQVFDKIMDSLEATMGREPMRRSGLTLLAGYLATVAAGGSPSLTLAQSSAQRWPEITAWAYTVGGIGERIVWTSAFDGLGRLVARELLRPLRLDEPPTCDFALDEAQVLVDPKLSDPLVHLRIKQSRIVSVALLPGVNVLIPISDSAGQEPRKPESGWTKRQAEPPAAAHTGGDPLAVLADAIWPYLRIRLEGSFRSAQGTGPAFRESEKSPSSRGRQRPTSQSGLPLREPEK